MKGRTKENIKKSMEQMHKIAEIMFDQKLEVIPTYIAERLGKLDGRILELENRYFELEDKMRAWKQ